MTTTQVETAILGYGSLLHVPSLQQTVPRLQRTDLMPVRVQGFARIFHLVSLSRSPTTGRVRPGLRAAVLDARPCPGRQMNAVRFVVRAGPEAEDLDRREFCYDRQPAGWREFYRPSVHGRALTYSVVDAQSLRRRVPQLYEERIATLGVNGLMSHAIRPVDDYLRMCIRGAFSWGQAFGHDFLAHTWLADGRPLCTWGPAVEATRELGFDVPAPPFAARLTI